MPDTALMMWWNAGVSRSGPVWPKPEIEQYTMSGFTRDSAAWSQPIRAATPGRKFSTATSATRARSSTTSRPRGWPRSSATLSLPALIRTK